MNSDKLHDEWMAARELRRETEELFSGRDAPPARALTHDALEELDRLDDDVRAARLAFYEAVIAESSAV
jgi:hypothetical protein